MDGLKDIGKSFPLTEVYRDIAQPATREVGAVLGNAGKVVRSHWRRSTTLRLSISAGNGILSD